MSDTNQKNRNTLIVVLGMHRSGTSVVARAMATLGGEFGGHLMPPVAGVNDKGFFEDVDVNAINVELLRAAELDWYSMTPIDLNCIDASLLDRLQTKAITVLREKCADNDTFVLKDPRITRLVPFWRPVFACLNLRVVYVVAVRNPISVAKSLGRVHHFADEKSYILWLAHLVATLEDTRDQERIFVDYDQLMDAPARELSRVSAATALPLRAEGLEEFERTFLEQGLRNTRFSVDDLDVVRSAPPQVKSVFSAMRRAAMATIDAHSPELDAAAEEGRRYLESIAPLLRYEWRLVQHVEEVTPALSEANARIHALELALRESKEQATERLLASEGHAAQRLRDSEEHSANLLRAGEAHAAVEIAARDQVIVRLEQAIAEDQRRREELVDQIGLSEQYANELKTQNEELSVALDALVSKAASQDAALARARDEIEQVFGSKSWRLTAPLRALRAFSRVGSSRGR